MRFGPILVAGLTVGLMVAAAGAQAQQAKAPAMVVTVGPAQQQDSAQQNSAQQQGPARLPDVTLGPTVKVEPRYVVVGVGCPGMLTARQQATGGAEIWTTGMGDQSAASATPRGLGIHVEFDGVRTAVKEIELRVSYLPLGLHVMQVGPATTHSVATQPRERAKTFNLDRVAAMRVAGDLLVGPAATITRVHLVSVTFADGHVWHAPSEDTCTVVPNRVMLVAGR